MISVIFNGSWKFAARRTLKIHSRFEFKDIIDGCLRRRGQHWQLHGAKNLSKWPKDRGVEPTGEGVVCGDATSLNRSRRYGSVNGILEIKHLKKTLDC